MSHYETISHHCELIAMDFNIRLATIENFANHAHRYFKPILKEFNDQRQAAHDRDWSGEEPPDDPYEVMIGGEEIEVAYQEYPVIEADELVGCFSLVHLASNIEDFLDALLKDANLKRPKKKKLRKMKKAEMSQKTLIAIHVLEKALGKDLDADTKELIKDIILARNDFVHHRRHQETATRFVARGDTRILFTPSEMEDALKTLRKMSKFLAKECQAIGRTIF